MTATLLSLLLLSLELVAAWNIPVSGRQVRGAEGRFRRADKTIQVFSATNTNYLANITVGGNPFSVSIDTGSSDLWIQKPVPNSQQSTTPATINYAVGTVTGPISFTEVSFSGFTIKDQAFIAVPPGGNADAGNDDGLIGLGPASGSVIRRALQDSKGAPFLDNVFRSDPSTPNFITVQLNRLGDSGTDVKGQFSVGTIADGMDKVNGMPKLAIDHVAVGNEANQHWTSDIDSVFANGEKVTVHSGVAGIAPGKLVAVYDSGFTFPQVPQVLSDALYAKVPGAKFDLSNGWWTLPCTAEVNLTFVIGGLNYPVHPFDTNMDLNQTDNAGNKFCIGAFQPMSTQTGGMFDVIMGMAYLRNAYMLVNFGDFVDGTSNTADPYMQLLSVTDSADAHSDFVRQRLNGQDNTNGKPGAPANSGSGSPTTTSSSPDKSKTDVESFFKKNLVYIAGAAGGLLFVLVVLGFFCCARNRRSAKGSGFVPGPYRPLDQPAPAPAMELHGPPQTYQSDPYGANHQYYASDASSHQPYTYQGGTYSDPYYNRA